MLPTTGSKASVIRTRNVASCHSSTFKALRASQMNTASDALRTRTAPTVIRWLSIPTNGCSIHASSGGITYSGPVGSRQPVVAHMSYGLWPLAIRVAARM